MPLPIKAEIEEQRFDVMLLNSSAWALSRD